MAISDMDVRKAFRRNNLKISDGAVASRIADLAEEFGYSATELSDKYDFYATNRGSAMNNEVTGKLLEDFSQQLDRRQPTTAVKPARPSRMSMEGSNVLRDQSNLDLTAAAARTPKPPPGKGSSSPAAATDSAHKRPRTSGAFSARQNSGQVVAALNDHLALDGQAMDLDQHDSAERCCVEVLPGSVAAHRHFMVDRLEDKVAYLDGRISQFAATVAAEPNAAPPLPVSAATQVPATYVGRVCCDAEGRLNDQSVMLEGGVADSAGARVRLDLSQIPSFRLFPGQIVAVTATNPTGGRLLATAVRTAAAAPMAASPAARLATFTAATGPAPLSVMVAAGPFTTADSLEAEPLNELLAAAARSPPDALVLLGPFVDVDNPAVGSGALDVTFEELFAMQVLQRLQRPEFRAACPGTRVLLAPATRDATAMPVFPQPPMRPPSASEAAGITWLPNPATFRLNEVVFGLVTSDVLMHLAGAEAQRGPGADRMAALAGHLVAQQSYYPLFPPALGTFLDTSLGAALGMPVTPDVLLLPSNLAPFAKLAPVCAGEDGHKVVAVNPGRLAKGSAGGTYAHLRIGPSPEGQALAAGQPAATNAPVLHGVDRRCRVECRRV